MVPYYCIVSYYNILFHDAFYDIMLYYIIMSSLLRSSYFIVVIIVTVTIITCYHITLCQYQGMLEYVLSLYVTSFYIISYHCVLHYIVSKMTGPRTPQLIRWAKGKHSGATELKTMGHEKASDT